MNGMNVMKETDSSSSYHVLLSIAKQDCIAVIIVRVLFYSNQRRSRFTIIIILLTISTPHNRLVSKEHLTRIGLSIFYESDLANVICMELQDVVPFEPLEREGRTSDTGRN